MKNNNLKQLNRTNRFVYKKYLKANDYQKAKMRKTLRDQLANLELLYKLMENDIK